MPTQTTVDDRVATGGAGKLERIDGFVEPRAARTTTRESRGKQDAVHEDLPTAEFERDFAARHAR